MDEELKNRLDELEKNVNTHTDKVGQNIRDVFSMRFNKVELDLRSYKNLVSVKFSTLSNDISNINTTLEENGMTFRG